jgi:hypothetical protein
VFSLKCLLCGAKGLSKDLRISPLSFSNTASSPVAISLSRIPLEDRIPGFPGILPGVKRDLGGPVPEDLHFFVEKQQIIQ